MPIYRNEYISQTNLDKKLLIAIRDKMSMVSVGSLLDAGANVNKSNLSGETAILLSFSYLKPRELFTKLVSLGADLNIRDGIANNILHYLFCNSNDPYFLENIKENVGGNFNKMMNDTNKWGYTPYMVMIKNRSSLKKLIEGNSSNFKRQGYSTFQQLNVALV